MVFRHIYADVIHRLNRLYFGRPCRVVLVCQDPLDTFLGEVERDMGKPWQPRWY